LLKTPHAALAYVRALKGLSLSLFLFFAPSLPLTLSFNISIERFLGDTRREENVNEKREREREMLNL
jgi:hypothetical protein